METLLPYYRGCLLGLAIGDAMGYAVDERSLEEIRRDYGPNGLMGFDLVNGYADVTSYTQTAVFAANGLLLGQTQGMMRGQMAPYVRYIRLGLREWAAVQRRTIGSIRAFCWVGGEPEFRGRRCMDNRMLDVVCRERFGSMEEPANRFDAPGAVTVPVAVGLFHTPRRIPMEEAVRLGAEAVALTHGSPMAFLTGGAVAYLIARILRDRVRDLPALILETQSVLQEQFGREYPRVADLFAALSQALALSKDPALGRAQAMELLGCRTMPQILAGALYACMTGGEDFDATMVTAVNHSGRSSAVGAVAGAIAGAMLGESGLPEFYLESLEPAALLRGLATDLFQGCPMDRASRMYDDDWARKYIHYGN